MSFEVRVPRLGWSMETGVLVRWLKRDGDTVKVGDPLFELEGEKATQEIEAVDAGVLRIDTDSPAPGSEVAVGQLLARIVTGTGDDVPAAKPVATAAVNTEQPIAVPVTIAVVNSTVQSGKQEMARRPASSPRARRVADELGVEWKSISGTGRNGRVRERDIRAAAQPAANGNSFSAQRRTIARRMLASAQQTAPVTLTRRINATNLVALRRQFRAAGTSVVPSYTDIVARLVAPVLERHPELAASWQDEQLAPHPGGGIDIGLGVDTDRGLVVPVLRNVAQQKLLELAQQSRDLIAKARAGQLSATEMQGSCFTITNLGAFGIEAFTPIINLPEVAILGLGAIRREAIASEDDRIVPCDQMTLSLTFDHRALDGAPAARFLQALSLALENPSASLLLG